MSQNMFKPLQPPYEFYLAPANTVKPAFVYTTVETVDVLSDPVAAWVKFGGSGTMDDGDISSDPITFKVERTFEKQPPPLNDVYSQRAYLTEVAISLGYKFRDFNVDGLAKILGNQTVEETDHTATTPTVRELDLDLGVDVGYTALVVRGMGVEESGAKLPRQWWFPLVYSEAAAEFMLGKTWSETDVMWQVLKSRSQGVGAMTWATELPT